jgi:hypothetical protein
MLSQAQLNNPEIYKFRNGMINVSWIVGMIRNIDRVKGTGLIQQTNNLNQAIPFVMRPGDSIPPKLSEGQTIKVVGRFIGFMTDGQPGHPDAHVEVLGFQQPSLLDMPPRQDFEMPVRPGTPTDELRPEAYGEGHFSQRLEREVRNPNANRVLFAGFVASYRYDPSKNPGVTNGVLTMYLRQSVDPQDVVIARVQNKLAEAFAKRLEVGVGIFIEGEARVFVKDLSKTPDATGVIPTQRILTIHARTVSPAQAVEHIRKTPEWKVQMVEEFRRRREERRQAQTQKPREATAAAGANNPAQASAPGAPTGGASGFALDPSLLQKLSAAPAAAAVATTAAVPATAPAQGGQS